MKLLWVYLLLINAFSFTLMLADKQKARKNRWRIPEATLLTAAALGGSLGALWGMRLFRHKTQKPKFSVGIPCLLVLHSLLMVALYIL